MRIIAIAVGCVSAFFVFYVLRLQVVTGFFRHIGGGGVGAFIGAVVFPLPGIGAGWASRQLWRRRAPVETGGR